MKWSLLTPAESSWESEATLVLGALLEFEVEPLREATCVPGAEAIFVLGDIAWSRALSADAGRAATLGQALLPYAEGGGLIVAVGDTVEALCSLGLLPGTLAANSPPGLRCHMEKLRVENVANPWAQRAMVGDVWQMPVRSTRARFTAPAPELERLERDGQILLRYEEEDAGGEGRGGRIAAVMNSGHNVLGMIPHPENVVDASLVNPQWPGLSAGRVFFSSVADWVDDGSRPGLVQSER